MALARHVVAMPYPGRGHINPMMVLARQLIARGVHVTFVVTQEWLSLINSPPEELDLRTIPNCIPSENGRAQNFQEFLEAVYTKMRGPFEEMMDGLEAGPPMAIVADTYLPWVVELGKDRGIPVVSVFTMSASFFSILLNFEKIPPPDNYSFPIREKDESLEKYISNLSSIKLSDVDPMFIVPVLLKLALQAITASKESQCIIFTSFYELESRVVDSLKKELNLPIYTLGPSIPYMIEPKDEYNQLAWLNSQPKGSVLYVSLGSFLSVSPSQLEEIAIGVRLSEVKFLWVARENVSSVQELCGNKGLVVSWCDQLNALKNPSIRGFLTHCGFNSTLETLFCGVPVLCFPIFWDQLIDRSLLADEWKIGVDLRGKMGKDGIVRREEIAKAVRELMDLGEDCEMRRRALHWRDVCNKAIEKDGSSFDSLSSFIHEFIDQN
ncbi:hypothetical protein LUZ60_011150 [Juncus effusus]|nr:hypothetical protein LUZ60_011150 [Juncus effusus]